MTEQAQFRNYDEIPSADGKKTERVAKPHLQITEELVRSSGGWPKRIDDQLFIHRGRDEFIYPKRASSLFCWIQQRVAVVDWVRGSAMVSKEEFYDGARQSVENYRAVEQLPHHPPMDGHYYAWTDLPESDGSALTGLLDRFSPASPVDRDLLLALFLTCGWGGPCGCRPAFLVKGPGPGTGKTSLAEAVGQVWGGHWSTTQTEDHNQRLTRLLTPSALKLRVALIDNLKSQRFSSPQLEGLITNPMIDGRRNHVGDARRPNNLTWIVTSNEGNLSADFAQRCVTIELATPPNSGSWGSGSWKVDLADYIRDRRDEIVADCISILKDGISIELESVSRWGPWERDVLQKLPDPAEAKRTILERQAEADFDSDECRAFEEFIERKLIGLGHDLATTAVNIQAHVAADWWRECLGIPQTRSNTAIAREIARHESNGNFRHLTRRPRQNNFRGYTWCSAADPTQVRNEVSLTS